MLKVLVLVAVTLAPCLSYSKIACSPLFRPEIITPSPITRPHQLESQVSVLFKGALPRIYNLSRSKALRMGGRSKLSLFNDFLVSNFISTQKIKFSDDAKVDIFIETIASPSLQLKSSLVIEGTGISRTIINLDALTLEQIQPLLVDLTLKSMRF